MLFMRQAAEPQAHVESGSVRTFLYQEVKELSKSCSVGTLAILRWLFLVVSIHGEPETCC